MPRCGAVAGLYTFTCSNEAPFVDEAVEEGRDAAARQRLFDNKPR